MKKSIKSQFIFCVAMPLIAIGIIVIVIALTIVKGAILKEVRNSLRATAVTTLAAYDQNSGDYIRTKNQDVWKGNYNISASEDLVDTIHAQSDMEVTFFYGDQRIMTSAKDKKQQRILDSKAGKRVVTEVLKKGREYFSENVSIDGTMFYGYYIPVYQNNSKAKSKPIGMVFAGTNKTEKAKQIQKIVLLISCSVMVAILVFGWISRSFAKEIVYSLQRTIAKLQQVASGKLAITFEPKDMQRKDEIGELARSVQDLQKELCEIIGNIEEHVVQLMDASNLLNNTAKDTLTNVDNISLTIDTIARGVSEQDQDMQTAFKEVLSMGEVITDTAAELENLQSNAGDMQNTGGSALHTLQELTEVNVDVEDAIGEIASQTKQTDNAAKQIKEASAFIADIAEETNLLALNASIEAARAGETGRGFAVVASQIQALADQSTAASSRIDQIVANLIADAGSAVETMEHVKEVILRQKTHMKITEGAVVEVLDEIQQSVYQFQQLAKRTSQLGNTRNHIIDIITGLSDISKENASVTQKANNSMNEVTQHFDHVGESAQKVKEVADQLEDSIKRFEL